MIGARAGNVVSLNRGLGGLAALVVGVATTVPVAAQIGLTSTTGSEGVTAATTLVSIDGAGNPSVGGDFSVSGAVAESGAFNRGLSLTIDAVGESTDSGARSADAMIDRDGSGRLGVRGVNNGINAREGFLIGIDASELPVGHAWQVTGIGFEFVNGDESYTIINRNDPSRRLTGSANGMIDVRDLDLWVNGGSSDAEVVAVFANPTADPNASFRVTAFELDVVKTATGPDGPWRSVLYPENWQPPEALSFYHDKFIQDFSHAGYQSGEAAIPRLAGPVFDVTTYGADPSGSADSTAAIQAAINAAASAGGGVVSLPPGTFKIAHAGGSEVLRMAGDGVVLRGSGPDQTFLLNTTVVMRGLTTIRIRGSNPSEGPPVAITADITTPTRRIHLADAASFAPGELVEVNWDFTEDWIVEHGQEAWWNAGTDIPDPANYRRLVTAVDTTGNWIEVDIPLRYACLTRDNARVRKLFGRIAGCGIEDLSIGNIEHPGSQWGETDYEVPGTAAYEVDSSWVIDVQRAIDCWVSNVRSFQPAGNTSTCHNPSNGIRLLASKNITVRDCHFQRPQYGGGGGNGYMYRLQHAEDCLVADCIAEFNRHGFVVSHSGTTGNVFLRCEDRVSNRATGSSGSYVTDGGDGSDNHMQFSHSNLWDRCRAVDSFYEAIFRTTSGHGLSSAHGVYWNTLGDGTAYPDKLVVTEQGRYGYVIGTSGTVDAVTTKDVALHNTAPADHIEGVGLGRALHPPSLYLDQIGRRLGSDISVRSVGLADGASAVEAVIGIDGTGAVGSAAPQEFEISGRSAGGMTADSSVRLSFDAVKSVSLDPSSYGAKIVDGLIERDSAGRIGVADGGIGTDGLNREALQLTVDASGLDPRALITVRSVSLSWLNEGESCQVLNLQKGTVAEIMGSGATYPDVEFDVSALGITVTGGTIRTLASIIPGPSSDLRVSGVKLTITAGDGIRISSESANDGASTLDLGIGTGSDGMASSLNPEFRIDGAVTPAGAGHVVLTLDAMANVDTASGSELADGVIDRDSAGRLGVAPGGINEFEGFGFSLDASAIDPRLAIRLASATVQYVNADESFTVVSRVDPSRRLMVGGGATDADIVIGSGVVTIDLRELGLSMAGGESGDIATLFGDDMPDASANFRLLAVELEAEPAVSPIWSLSIHDQNPSVVIDWSVDTLFEPVLLYRTEDLRGPWRLVGEFPGLSQHQEPIAGTPRAFYRIELPFP